MWSGPVTQYYWQHGSASLLVRYLGLSCCPILIPCKQAVNWITLCRLHSGRVWHSSDSSTHACTSTGLRSPKRAWWHSHDERPPLLTAPPRSCTAAPCQMFRHRAVGRSCRRAVLLFSCLSFVPLHCCLPLQQDSSSLCSPQGLLLLDRQQWQKGLHLVFVPILSFRHDVHYDQSCFFNPHILKWIGTVQTWEYQRSNVIRGVLALFLEQSILLQPFGNSNVTWNKSTHLQTC